jgi:signal peptidase I
MKKNIGIPGDEVNIKEGYVYINGEKLNETYVKGQTYSEELILPIVVPVNKLFVLGDNRPVSKDSREFGLINYNQVEGKAVFRVFPFNKIGVIR